MAEKVIARVEVDGAAVAVGEDTGYVTLTCRPQKLLMEPHEARALATYLVAVADGIEGKQQTDPHAG